jgi:Undecaprenyl-phosphate galactose phosphotransferase WbaP
MTVLAVFVSDFLAVLFTCWSAHTWASGVLAAVVTLGCFAVCGLYPGPFLHPAEEWRRIFWCAGAGAAILSGPSFFAGIEAWALTATAAIVFRTAIRKVFARCRWWGLPTVLVASGTLRMRLLRALNGPLNRGLKVVACVDDQTTPPRTSRREYAIVAMQSRSVDQLAAVVERYSCFRGVFLSWDMEGLSGLVTDTGNIGDLFGVTVRQNLACFVPKFIKRSLDLSVAIGLSFVLMPLLATLWILIKVSSPGPALFGHRRIGQDGRYFTVWKFRTMIVNADRVLATYLESNHRLQREWDLTQKLKDDPRNTPVGRFLRKVSLDELPQLWNVLRGEMSLVGPRPIVDSEVKHYDIDFSYYLKVRPGVTGMWQVSGRNDTSYTQRVSLDRFYVRNWSVWLDLYILAKTARTVLTGRGAY